MRHQLEVDIKAAFQNIQEFRAKFETDKYLRAQWRQDTGQDLDIAIDIQDEGGYRMQQSKIESRIKRAKTKMDKIEEEEEDDDFGGDDDEERASRMTS